MRVAFACELSAIHDLANPREPENTMPVPRQPSSQSRSRWVPLVLTLLTLLVTSCDRTDPVTVATGQKIFLLGNGAEPRALDPHLIQSVGDSNIMRALFEGLTAYHVSDDTIHEPGVAERWEPNADFTQWTFFLRDDAKWSNGDPVTAGDFVYAYNRILHPDMGAPYASMLYFLKDAKEFNEGTIPADQFDKVGVKAVDDRTLVFDLVDPTPYFPDVVKHATYFPLHRATIEKFGKMTDQYSLWQQPGNHIGNGPFQLKTWRINDRVEVERNPHYWDNKTTRLNGIVFLPYDNNFTEERAFRDGLLHKTYIIPPDLIDYHKEHNPELTHTDTYAGSYFFRCNVTKAPLDNKMLRKALAFAIDRETLVKYVTRGGQQPAYAFTPPAESGYQPPQGLVEFDPAKAKRFLTEAGYSNGSEVPPFTIFINTSEQHKDIASAIQDMWKKHLGLESVTIQNQEWKVFQKTVTDLGYQVARAGWIADYVDPTTFLNMWNGTDSNNNTGWSNPRYEALLKEAAGLSDTNARYEKLRQAETILMEELPVLPIYWYTQTYLLDLSVKNWHPLLLDNHPYKHIDLRSGDRSSEVGDRQ